MAIANVAAVQIKAGSPVRAESAAAVSWPGSPHSERKIAPNAAAAGRDQCCGASSLIGGAMLLDERLERDPTALVDLGIPRALGVEADRALALLELVDLRLGDEAEGCIRVNEATDQPDGGCSGDSKLLQVIVQSIVVNVFWGQSPGQGEYFVVDLVAIRRDVFDRVGAIKAFLPRPAALEGRAAAAR